MKPGGKVYLVGGGPGDPGLLTLRAAQCLALADVVLYDYLVNPRILDHARADSQQICLGRHGRDRIMPPAEINARMIDFARQGLAVVRLKGGDPAVFAHLADEIAALEAAALDYEIVPGITAALAVGSYSGIPLTHADAASAIALVTGHERADKQASNLDYTALAAFPGTLVLYMGVTTAAEWSDALIAAGKPGDTPVAIVRRCSWPDQETIRTTLAHAAGEIQARRLRPPALFIVGPVAALSWGRNWFVERPLFQQRVLVTRPAHQVRRLVALLEEQGAEVWLQPALEIGPPEDWAPVDRAIDQLDSYDWLLFTSSNGVRSWMDRLLTRHDLRSLGDIKLAVVGPGTADELARYHLRPDLVPSDFRAESLALELQAEAALGRRFLWPRANRGRDVLADELRSGGGRVERVVVYASRAVTRPDEAVTAALAAGQIDWVTVTSSASAESLAALFGPQLAKARLASISPQTSEQLRMLGFAVAAEASQATDAAMVDAIARATRQV